MITPKAYGPGETVRTAYGLTAPAREVPRGRPLLSTDSLGASPRIDAVQATGAHWPMPTPRPPALIGGPAAPASPSPARQPQHAALAAREPPPLGRHARVRE
eukprot:scaffold2592_cov395-Prasinococcus_capsulatus_cf.AAC.5